MKYSRADARPIDRDGFSGWVYNTRDQFSRASASYLEVTGSHGLTKNTVNDRIYYVVEGQGEFIIGAQTVAVEPTDVMIVPKDVEYDFWAVDGKTLKLFLVNAPAFDPDGEIKMDR
jgi:mannose-6-phosphate isomerase-like protein (cupin superfamily)